MYRCGGCGLAVAVAPGKDPIKVCECDAPIIAEMAAKMEGRGGLNERKELPGHRAS